MTIYRTASVMGTDVFYREAGDPSDPTVIFLHGFPSSSAQYEQLMGHLKDRFHVIAPDYPGFGRSPALDGTATFGRLAEVIEEFITVIGLDRFSLYMFDFGAPIGFTIASRKPDRVDALILQNANAYQAGFGPAAKALMPYWQDRAAAEPAARQFLTLEATRSQYLAGVPQPETVNPDLWELDQRYLDVPGRDRVMLDLLYDIRSTLTDYPQWQQYLRGQTPPALIVWGQNDTFFTADGARAYLDDLPAAELHLLDTGHFATATHHTEIAELITRFLSPKLHPGQDGL